MYKYLIISIIFTLLFTILAIRLSRYNLNILTGTISLIASEKYGWVYKIGASIGVIILLFPFSQISMTTSMMLITLILFFSTLGFINVELRKYRTIHIIFTTTSSFLSVILINLLNPSGINILIGIFLGITYIYQKTKYKGNALTVLLLYVFIMINLGIVMTTI